jgi:hypothetical protein
MRQISLGINNRALTCSRVQTIPEFYKTNFSGGISLPFSLSLGFAKTRRKALSAISN